MEVADLTVHASHGRETIGEAVTCLDRLRSCCWHRSSPRLSVTAVGGVTVTHHSSSIDRMPVLQNALGTEKRFFDLQCAAKIAALTFSHLCTTSLSHTSAPPHILILTPQLHLTFSHICTTSLSHACTTSLTTRGPRNRPGSRGSFVCAWIRSAVASKGEVPPCWRLVLRAHCTSLRRSRPSRSGVSRG